MNLPFMNRTSELRKLNRIVSGTAPVLGVVYGRRRCGKSRLLQELPKAGTVYYLADQSDSSLQRQAMARELSGVLPGFDDASYPSWSALFDAVNKRSPRCKNRPITVIIDEFPYLASEDPSLPSVLQKTIDTHTWKTHLILCGSSQRMMKGIVLDESAPLYGRAREIIKVRPLKAGWMGEALGVDGKKAVEHFAVWGGVPRYWELCSEYSTLRRALRELVFDRDGILHEEPRRLLRDNMRTDTQPHSLLALIGSGVHRISEMAGRMGKPAMNLTKPLDLLIDMDLVSREVPFGEAGKNSKRTLYTINDPFCRFWYTYVQPNLSVLEQELYDRVTEQWRETFPHICGQAWESLARESIPHLRIGGYTWNKASRWWARRGSGSHRELDIVAESTDGTALLLGEVKWGAFHPQTERARLKQLSEQLPFAQGKRVVTACFGMNVKPQPARNVFGPDAVLKVLR